MKRHVGLFALIAFAGAAIVACTDDPTPNPPGPTPDAGPVDSGKPDSTTPSDAGDAGNVGDASDAGDATTPVEAGGDAGPDGSTLDGGVDGSDAGTDDGGPPVIVDPNPAQFGLLYGTSLNRHKSELTVVSIATPAYVGRLASTSIDTVPFGSSGRAFLAQRDLGNLLVMEPTAPWQTALTLTLTGGSDVSTVAADNTTKAYVARRSTNSVLVYNTTTGVQSGTLSLTPYAAAADTDGVVEVQASAFDPATKRVYFLLQRLIAAEAQTSDSARKCLPKGGAIVAFDTTTDTVVDLNGAAAGEAIELLGAAPQTLSADFAGGRLLIANNGCYLPTATPPDPGGDVDDGAGVRQARGIESVNLTTGATTWLYQTADQDGVQGLIYVDANHAFVSKNDDWHAWNPTRTSLGAIAASFPQAPFYDGLGHILGLAPAPTANDVTLLKLVSWDVSTGVVTTVIPTEPFQSPRPSTELLTQSALVR